MRDAPVTFELGKGLRDQFRGASGPVRYWINELWNELSAHIFDPADTCLDVGATEGLQDIDRRNRL